MKVSLNIKVRLTLWYLLVTAVLIVFFSTAAYFLLSQGLYMKTVNLWDMRVAQIEKTMDGKSIITGFSYVDQREWDNQKNGVVKVSRYSKNEILESMSEEGTIMVETFLIDKTVLDTLDMSEDDSVWFYTYLTENNSNVMVVTQSTNDVAAILGAFRQVLFIIIPVTLVLAGILGYFIVKRMLRPVQSITESARQIEEKSLSKRLSIPNNDELGKLASTLNYMFERLEGAFNRERQFTADASHELRTPLAIVQGETTLALQKERKVEEYLKSLVTISEESERMSSILKKLLFLARGEGDKPLEYEEVNLTEFFNELASDTEVLHEQKGIQFQVIAEDNLVIKGDKLSLRELFFNLLDNAIRHTPQGGNISVTIRRKVNSACVSVKDSGTGIPKERINHIFERFYRVDKSRSRSEGGAGLGLSICQRIAELHGGRVTVESQVGKGSIFSVLLPVVERS